MSTPRLKDKKLIIGGSGIKFISHLTSETEALISTACNLLYLVNEPATEQWLKKKNPNALSLEHIYYQYKKRADAYQKIAEYILQQMESCEQLLVIFYGHPTIYNDPSILTAKLAKHEGATVEILPGISAADCLFADLQINPGSCGYQSFEATDFLLHNRQFDKSSHLILWQVGILGHTEHIETAAPQISLLIDHLLKFYPTTHQVISYEAALYPGFPPDIQTTELNNAHNLTYSAISTLYIPPTETTIPPHNIFKQSVTHA